MSIMTPNRVPPRLITLVARWSDPKQCKELSCAHEMLVLAQDDLTAWQEAAQHCSEFGLGCLGFATYLTERDRDLYETLRRELCELIQLVQQHAPDLQGYVIPLPSLEDWVRVMRTLLRRLLSEDEDGSPEPTSTQLPIIRFAKNGDPPTLIQASMLSTSENPRDEGQKSSNVKGKDINNRLQRLYTDYPELEALPAAQLAKILNCSTGTLKETKIWKTRMIVRKSAVQDRVQRLTAHSLIAVPQEAD